VKSCVDLPINMINMAQQKFDAIIVGGSYAGLSCAMALGRSLRKTLVIDSGRPCNASTPHSHNFITQDGKTPEEIASVAREQVEQYKTVELLDDLAVEATKTGEGFEIVTQKGGRFTCEKLVFATGIKDMMPEVKGFADCWGISVVHCPYCHGYEYRDRSTAIWAMGDTAFHMIPLIDNLTKDLTVLTNGKSVFTEEQLDKLKKRSITVFEGEIAAIGHNMGRLENVVFKDGTKMAFDALYARLPFVQHTDLPVLLGCELTDPGHLKVDNFQQTTVPGVYACGDNSSGMRSVANAVAGGNMTGAMVNMELVKERF